MQPDDDELATARARGTLSDGLLARAEAAERERDAARAALREIVAALPTCDHCAAPATRAFRRGGARYCDAHGAGVPEYPRAAALAAAAKVLGDDATKGDGR